MNREEALKQADEGIAALHVALGQGRSEQLEQYLEMMSRFHNYSFGNVMLILTQNPEATHVAGFRKWKQLGRNVKKGEKGIGIIAPLRRRQKTEDTETGEEQSVSVLGGFKVVHVFDVSQTEGKELPEFASISGDAGDKLARIEAVIRDAGIELEYAPLGPGTLGCSSGGRIIIRPDMEPAVTFSVAVHEASHEILHHGQRRHETTKTIRETEAEAVAFVVCRAFGLDSATRSSDYIQLYRGKPETLAESLEFVQKTAAHLIDAISSAKVPGEELEEQAA